MTARARLQRLERVEGERQVDEMVRRLAERHGLAPDEIRRHAEEMRDRIARWGIEGELRSMAEEYGWNEVEMHKQYAQSVLACLQ